MDSKQVKAIFFCPQPGQAAEESLSIEMHDTPQEVKSAVLHELKA